MKPKQFTVIFLAAAVLNFSWEYVKAEQFGDLTDLTLRISTPTPEVLPLAPVQITIMLSNDTNKVIVSHASIAPAYGLLKVYVAYEKEPFKQFRTSGSLPIHFVRIDKISIPPGYRKEHRDYVYYANIGVKDRQGRYFVEKPGTYRVKAELHDIDSKKKIESNILLIKAVEPTGEDAAAYKWLKNLAETTARDKTYGGFLLRCFCKHAVGSRRNIHLAGHIYQDNEDLFEKGVKLLEKVANDESFFLAEDALEKLYEKFRHLGKEEQAMKYQAILAERDLL